MKKYWSVLIAILFIGCARPYAQYYHDNIRGMDTSNIIFTTEEPKLLRGNMDTVDADCLQMAEEGYALLGYSSFHGPKFNENQAVNQARQLKASVVVVYSKYLDTQSGIQPIILPDIKTSVSSSQATAYGSAFGSGGYASGYATGYGTGTTTTYGTQVIYQPYSIDRFDQGATYWAKTKGQISGVLAKDLPPELRQKIGSNKGLLVIGVVKRSPAFSADILRGDIIKKVNNIEIADLKQYFQTMVSNANKKVTITLVRDGKEVVKEVKLNPAPEGAEANLQKLLAK
jgi:membrane-associated protease RseP (regulator of RpoE activity)